MDIYYSPMNYCKHLASFGKMTSLFCAFSRDLGDLECLGLQRIISLIRNSLQQEGNSDSDQDLLAFLRLNWPDSQEEKAECTRDP